MDDDTPGKEVGPLLLYKYEGVYSDSDDIDHDFESPTDDTANSEPRAHAEDRFIVNDLDTALREFERYRGTVNPDEFILQMHSQNATRRSLQSQCKSLPRRLCPTSRAETVVQSPHRFSVLFFPVSPQASRWLHHLRTGFRPFARYLLK